MAQMFVLDLDGDITIEEATKILSPLPDEQIVFIRNPHDANCESLAALAGVFESKSEARKAGFAGPVPWGVELLGTNQRTFWVWNPKPSLSVTLSKKRIHTNRWWDLALQFGSLLAPDGTPWPVLQGTRRILF